MVLQKKNIRIYFFVIFMLILIFNLFGCQFDISEQLKKIDSEEGRKELPEDAYNMDRVESQKRKDIKDSYELKGGVEDLKKLDIVEDVTVEEGEIKVDFLVKDMEGDKESEKTKQEIVWGNTLFLFYTIYDSFPNIEEIHVSADYYFIDRYGNPYKERVFRSHIHRSELEAINRDYLQAEMISDLCDFYMSEFIINEEVEEEDSN